MTRLNRRKFLQSSGGALAIGVGISGAALANGEGPARPAFSETTRSIPDIAADEGKKPLRLGLIIDIGKDPDAALSKVHELGMPTAQIFVDEFEMNLVDRLRQSLEKYQIEATSLVVGGPGKEVWDFYEGPLTIGLVPKATRTARIAHIKKASDFAKRCGILAVQTHCGFIPENPNDPVYAETVAAIREVATYCKHNGTSATRPARKLPSRSFARWVMSGWIIRVSISISRT